jgi:hypothetical protein
MHRKREDIESKTRRPTIPLSLSLSLSLSLREIPLLSVFHSTHQPTTDRNALSLLFFLEIIFIFISIVIFLF